MKSAIKSPFGFIFRLMIFVFALGIILTGGFSASAAGSAKGNSSSSGNEWWLNEVKVKDDYKGSTAPIVCMDVSSEEQILLTLTNDTLLLLDNNGTLQKAFEFSSPGSYYAVFNDLTNNIQLYFVRGGDCIEFTAEGEVCKHFHQGGDFAWARALPAELTVNHNTYKISKAPLTVTAERFSLLTKTTASGEESVLYDVYSFQLFRNILGLSVFIIGFTCIPLIIIKANISYAKVRRQLFPAPKKEVKPVTPIMRVIKWSIFTLIVLKFVFTVISLINFRTEGVSPLAIRSFFGGWILGAKFVGSIGAILFPALSMLVLASLGVGAILLVSLKRKPLPSLFLVGIPTALDFFILTFSFWQSLSGLILNLIIIGLLIFYTVILKKHFRSEA